MITLWLNGKNMDQLMANLLDVDYRFDYNHIHVRACVRFYNFRQQLYAAEVFFSSFYHLDSHNVVDHFTSTVDPSHKAIKHENHVRCKFNSNQIEFIYGKVQVKMIPKRGRGWKKRSMK